MKTKLMVLISASAFLVAILASCKGASNKKEHDHVVMDTSMLYNTDQVLGFVKAHPENSKDAASVFSKAVDVYRNKKDAGSAYQLFINSVTLYPTARGYYELGNVCMEKKEYEHAIAAFQIAEQLGYEPVSKLLYNMACVYSLQDKCYESSTYIGYAIEAGYSNIKQIMEDKDLEIVRKSGMLEHSYQDAMSGSSDPEVTLWQSFKHEFKPVNMPVVLDMKTVVDDKHYINFEFEKFVSEMRTEKFSRDVGKEFYYYAVVESNNNYTALVYAIKNTIMSEEAPMSYVLVSFDGRGILIDKKTVGGQMEFKDPYLVGTIKSNLHFEVKKYNNTYQKDPEKDGYKDNPIVKSDLLATEYYKIDDKGKFVQQSGELSMR